MCVTTATCEVQYVVLCDASKDALFTRAVSVFLQLGLSGMRVDIFGDNESAKAITDNPSSASRSKHIYVKLDFIRGLVRAGEVRVSHVGTAEQHADVLTKPLWRKKFMSQLRGPQLPVGGIPGEAFAYPSAELH